MYFVLSKVLWLILLPFNIILLLLLSGRLILSRWPRSGKRLISFGLALLFVCGLDFVPGYMSRILENRIQAGNIPARIDGIIVLAGMVDMEASRNGLIELTGQSDRIVEGVILAKKHPEAKLILSGSSGFLDQKENFMEADYLKRLAISLGIAKERILVDRNSRNTHEHSLAMAKLVSQDGQWVLVTSAFHMPRSLGCFRRAGLRIIPYPVDYKTRINLFENISLSSFIPSLGNLTDFGVALHEWIGLVVYWLSGYTDSLFPLSV